MADNIKANVSSITGAGGQLNTHAQNVRQAIDDVSRVVAGLEGEWAGDSHTSFADFMTQWNKAALNVHQLLDFAQNNTKKTGTSFQDLDTEIGRGFKL